MKKALSFFILSFLCLPLMAQTDEILLNIDCSVFEVSASKDMSQANSPHNWNAACGVAWQSNNVFAQFINEGSMSFLGKAIRFGSLNKGDGEATMPSIDLSKKKNQQIVIRTKVTAGGDKSGNLDILIDGKSVGKISASNGNKGRSFSRDYYPYEFEVKEGNVNSSIKIIHSSIENKGYLYINQFSVIKITN